VRGVLGVAELDLARLDVPSGGSRRLDPLVPVGPLALAGQPYRVAPDPVPVRLDVGRSASGRALRLRAGARVEGPCMRCLAPAGHDLSVDTREFQAAGRGGAGTEPDDDLDSEYLSGPERDRLDLASWVRDSLLEAVPLTVLCRKECAGLCPGCGADLNAGPCVCVPSTGDPRWAALGDLAERLRDVT
jgi:uncharacterized protein